MSPTWEALKAEVDDIALQIEKAEANYHAVERLDAVCSARSRIMMALQSVPLLPQDKHAVVESEVNAVVCRLWILSGELEESEMAFDAAKKAFQAALKASPSSTEANYRLATVLRMLSGDLTDVERLLRKATACAARTTVMGTEVETNAKAGLAFHLLQEGKSEEADSLLLELMYTHRLSRLLLNYSERPPGPWRDVDFVKAVDGALPTALYNHMKRVYSPTSIYWKEHQYSMRAPYFSYVVDLSWMCKENAFYQVVHALYKLCCHLIPAVTKARYAESWSHCRPHSNGHQLHFDSGMDAAVDSFLVLIDNEGLTREGGKPRHPIASCVLYLSGDVGGPTLVTNQRLGDPLADRGWVVFPKENRFVCFDGSVLHGVIPGKGNVGNTGQRRVTFMIAFWESVEVKLSADPGSSRPYPSSSTDRFSWPRLHEVDIECEDPSLSRRTVLPSPVEVVWEKTGAAKEASSSQTMNIDYSTSSALGLPPYNACFQGF